MDILRRTSGRLRLPIEDIYLGPEPVKLHPALLGRVCVVAGCPVHFRDDIEEKFSEAVDRDRFSFGSSLISPLVVTVLEDHKPEWNRRGVAAVLQQYIDKHQLMEELSGIPTLTENAESANPDSLGTPIIPTALVHLDAAFEKDPDRFDCSVFAVFDGLVPAPLVRELLALLASPDWDPNDGPDPEMWAPGALQDTQHGGRNGKKKKASWGLQEEALEYLCASPPFSGAVAAFEDILRNKLFPNHIVSRLPAAVLGEDVTSLTANAPRHGEDFEFHIDADPFQAPPSPWTDAFGLYRNRVRE